MREYQTLDNGRIIKTFDDGAPEASDYLHHEYDDGYAARPPPRKPWHHKPKLLLCFDEDRRKGEFAPSLLKFFGKPYTVIYDHFTLPGAGNDTY